MPSFLSVPCNINTFLNHNTITVLIHKKIEQILNFNNHNLGKQVSLLEKESLPTYLSFLTFMQEKLLHGK